jgi:hypothetical protein
VEEINPVPLEESESLADTTKELTGIPDPTGPPRKDADTDEVYRLKENFDSLEKRTRNNRALIWLLAVVLPLLIFLEGEINLDAKGLSGSVRSRKLELVLPSEIKWLVGVAGLLALGVISKDDLIAFLNAYLKR